MKTFTKMSDTLTDIINSGMQKSDRMENTDPSMQVSQKSLEKKVETPTSQNPVKKSGKKDIQGEGPVMMSPKLSVDDFYQILGNKFTVQSEDKIIDVEDRFFTLEPTVHRPPSTESEVGDKFHHYNPATGVDMFYKKGTPVSAATVAEALRTAVPGEDEHDLGDRVYTEEQLRDIGRASAIKAFAEEANKKAGLELVQTKVKNYFKHFEASGESPWVKRTLGGKWPFRKTCDVVEILVARVPIEGVSKGDGTEWNEWIVPASKEINQWLQEEGKERGEEGWNGVLWEENSRTVYSDEPHYPGTLRLVLSKENLKSQPQQIPTYDPLRRQGKKSDCRFVDGRTGDPIKPISYLTSGRIVYRLEKPRSIAWLK